MSSHCVGPCLVTFLGPPVASEAYPVTLPLALTRFQHDLMVKTSQLLGNCDSSKISKMHWGLNLVVDLAVCKKGHSTVGKWVSSATISCGDRMADWLPQAPRLPRWESPIWPNLDFDFLSWGFSKVCFHTAKECCHEAPCSA